MNEEQLKNFLIEIQISVYTQLINIIQQANRLEFPCDEGLSMRRATVEEKFKFIVMGLDELIKILKEQEPHCNSLYLVISYP